MTLQKIDFGAKMLTSADDRFSAFCYNNEASAFLVKVKIRKWDRLELVVSHWSGGWNCAWDWAIWKNTLRLWKSLSISQQSYAGIMNQRWTNYKFLVLPLSSASNEVHGSYSTVSEIPCGVTLREDHLQNACKTHINLDVENLYIEY